jgi:hypothetical protein
MGQRNEKIFIVKLNCYNAGRLVEIVNCEILGTVYHNFPHPLLEADFEENFSGARFTGYCCRIADSQAAAGAA